ncbi:MAG: hypothetical protein ACKO25_06025 [Cyanobium sp.]
MTTSPPYATPSPSLSSGESLASLPRWRQWLSMLNWRRDPGYEQRRMLHEQRMKQLAIEIEQIKSDSERIEKDTEWIRNETEQLRRENARLRQLNVRGRALLSSVDQLCFPPESSSIPSPSTAPGSGISSP